jgi:D-glycero-beta-D-manno-heptose-7-phosphate kinase
MILNHLESLLKGAKSKRVAVVGDLMLDRYIWGRVDRISPEAPVPVVNTVRRSHALGGCANVVANLCSLGATVLPLGVVGADPEADVVFGLFRSMGIESAHILRDDSRPTTLKTRIIAHEQHVVRVDEESTRPIPLTIQTALLTRLDQLLPNLDALIFEDYDKGVLTPELIFEVRERCVKAGVMTAVDPKLAHFHDYGAVDLFKPNESELLQGMACQTCTDDDLSRMVSEFRKRSACGDVVVTRGSKGMSLFDSKNQRVDVPALRRAIVDVSGAGDTVIAALVLAKLQGYALSTAGKFASLCAAVSCGELGAVPVDPALVMRLNEGKV